MFLNGCEMQGDLDDLKLFFLLDIHIKIEALGVMDKLQWGNRKRLRFVKVKESTVMNGKSDGNGIVVKKKITSQRVDRRVVNEQDSHHPIPPVHSSSPQHINSSNCS
ncbi:hypothetical protein Hanom_Chr01g00073101 [Helianthus anomalus]